MSSSIASNFTPAMRSTFALRRSDLRKITSRDTFRDFAVIGQRRARSLTRTMLDLPLLGYIFRGSGTSRDTMRLKTRTRAWQKKSWRLSDRRVAPASQRRITGESFRDKREGRKEGGRKNRVTTRRVVKYQRCKSGNADGGETATRGAIKTEPRRRAKCPFPAQR